jgi:hypothetical protein
MKKIIKALLTLAVIFPFILSAQHTKADKLFEKYADETGFYYLNLETNMFSIVDEEASPTQEPQIVYLKMLTFKGSENVNKDASNIYDEFQKAFDSEIYKGLIDVNSKGEKVDMLVKKEDGRVSEIIIILFDETETMLVSASGNFDLKKLATFKQIENCKRLSSLKQLCED